MLFIIIKKKGELKAVYGFVSKVILSVWQDEVTRAGESSRTTVCFEWKEHRFSREDVWVQAL